MSTAPASKLVTARYDGDVFSDARQGDFLLYAAPAGKGLLLGIGSNAGNSSVVRARDSNLTLNAQDATVENTLRISGDILMPGGFRIVDGLRVTGGDGTHLFGGMNVYAGTSNEPLFVVDDATGIAANRDIVAACNVDAQTATVRGDLVLQGKLAAPEFRVNDLRVDSNADVEGRLTVQQRLAGDSQPALDVGGARVDLNRDVAMTRDVSVHGAAAFPGGVLTVGGDAFAVDDAAGGGGSGSGSGVFVGRALTLSSNLDARGASNLLRGELDVVGAARLRADARVEGGLDVRGPVLEVTPDATSLGASLALRVDDAEIVLARNVHTDSDVFVSGTFEIAGSAARFAPSGSSVWEADANGVAVSRAATLACNVTAGADVDVRGALDVDQGGFVVDATSVRLDQKELRLSGGALYASDGLTLSNTLGVGAGGADVTGAVTVREGDLVVSGGALRVAPIGTGGVPITAFEVRDAAVTAHRDFVMDSDLDVGGSADVAGDARLRSAAQVDGSFSAGGGALAADAASGVAFARDALARSNLSVRGDADFTGDVVAISPGTCNVLTADAQGVTARARLMVTDGADLRVEGGGKAVVSGGDVELDPDATGTRADMALVARSAAVDVRRPFNVLGDVPTTLQGDLYVERGGSTAARVDDAAVTLRRPVDIACNLTVDGGRTALRGGPLRVTPAAGVTEALVVDDSNASFRRDVNAESNLRAVGSVRSLSSFVLDPEDGNGPAFEADAAAQSFVVQRARDVALRDASNLLLDAAAVDVTGGVARINPGGDAGSPVVQVSSSNVDIARALQVHGDARFVGDAFALVNIDSTGATPQEDVALSVDLAAATVRRPAVLECNLELRGTLEVAGDSAVVRGDLDVEGGASVGSNLAVAGSAFFDGALLAARVPTLEVGVPPDVLARVGGADSRVELLADARVEGGTFTVIPVAGTGDAALEVDDARVHVRRPASFVGTVDVSAGGFSVTPAGQDGSAALTVGSDSDVASDLWVTVARDLVARSNVRVDGAATVTGDVAASNALYVGGGAEIVGAAGLYVASNVATDGDATFAGALDVGGSALVRGTTFRVEDASNAGEAVASFAPSNAYVAAALTDLDGAVRVRQAFTAATAATGGGDSNTGVLAVEGAPTQRVAVDGALEVRNGPTSLSGGALSVETTTQSAGTALEVTDAQATLMRDLAAACNIVCEGDATVATGGGAALIVGESSNVFAVRADDDALRVRRSATMACNLDVAGAVAVGGQATLSGRVIAQGGFETPADLQVGGAGAVRGGIVVATRGEDAFVVDHSNVTALRDVEARCNVNVEGALDVAGDTRAFGSLEVRPGGSAASDAVLRVTSSAVRTNRDLTANSNLVVTRDATVARDLLVQRNADIAQALSASQVVAGASETTCNAVIGGGLRVVGDDGTGTATAEALVVSPSNVAVNREVDVDGAARFVGALTVSEGGTTSLAVGATDVEVNRDLNVTGELVVQSDAAFNNDVEVARDAFVRRSLFVDCNATVASDATVQGDATVGGAARVEGASLLVEDASKADSNARAILRADDSEVRISRHAYADSDLDVGGRALFASNVIVNGELAVSGPAQYAASIRVPDAQILGAPDRKEPAPAFAFVDDEDTGVFRADSNALGWAVGGAEAARLDAGGRLGVGVATPGERVDVAGSVRASVQVLGADAATAAAPAFAWDGDRDTGAFPAGSDVFAFATAGAERARIDAGGQVGIGQTAPTERLHVSGGKARVDGAVLASAASAAAPAYAFVGDSNTGAFSPAADAWAVSTAGAERMRVDAGTAFVGINASAPSERLDVAGKVRARDQTLGWLGGTAADPAFSFAGDCNTGVFRPAEDEWAVSTAGAERVRVDANGRVGIAQTTPQERLHVSSGKVRSDGPVLGWLGGTAGEPAFSFAGDCNTGVFRPAEDEWAVSTAGAERFRVDGGGRVGLGIGDPGEALDVSGSVRVTGQFLGTGVDDGAGLPSFAWSEARDTGLFLANADSGVAVATQGQERARFAGPTGFLGVGLTAPSERLHVASGRVRADDQVLGYATAAATAAAPAYAFVGDEDTGAFLAAADEWAIGTGGAERLRVSAPANQGFVGVNVTAPTARLDVGGKTRARDQVLGYATAAATAAAPAYAFAGDEDTGAFRPAADEWAVSTAATERLRVDATGRIGIGTTAPGELLDVAGGSVRGDRFLGAADGTAAAPAFAWSADRDTGVYRVAEDVVAVGTGGVERLRVDAPANQGFVGVNVAAPTARLDVGGKTRARDQVLGYTTAAATAAAPAYAFEGDEDTGAFRPAADEWAIGTGGAERLRVSAPGNQGFVGVAVAAPTARLDVGGQLRARDQALFSDGTAAAPGAAFWADADTGAFRPAADELAFSTAGAERARVDAGGRVGINKAAPTERVDVVGNVRTTAQFLGTDSNDGPAAPSFSFTEDRGAGMFAAGSNVVGFATSNTERVRIAMDGQVGVNTTAPVEQLDVAGKVRARDQFLGFPGGDESRPAFSWTGDIDTGMFRPAENTIGFATDGLERARFAPNGYLGVNLSNPVEWVDVLGSVYVREQVLGAGNVDSVLEPAFSWREDRDTGMYYVGTDELGIATGGVDRVRVTGGDGFVGVNVQAPEERLDVRGKVQARDQVLGTPLDKALDPGFSWTDDSNTGMFHPADDEIGFTTGGSERVRIDDVGQVGIGIQVPGERLDVDGNVRLSGQMLVPAGTAAAPAYAFDTDRDTGMFLADTDALAYATDGTEWMRVQPNGYVGINVAAPTERLDVDGKVRARDQFLAYPADGAAAPGYAWDGDTDTGMFRPAIDMLAFTTAGAERVRVDDQGRLGVNETNPAFTLDVTGTANVTGATTLGNTLDVQNATTLQGATSVTNTLDVSDDVTFNADLTLSGRVNDHFVLLDEAANTADFRMFVDKNFSSVEGEIYSARGRYVGSDNAPQVDFTFDDDVFVKWRRENSQDDDSTKEMIIEGDVDIKGKLTASNLTTSGANQVFKLGGVMMQWGLGGGSGSRTGTINFNEEFGTCQSVVATGTNELDDNVEDEIDPLIITNVTSSYFQFASMQNSKNNYEGVAPIYWMAFGTPK